jgi:hypothetical protein
MKVIIAGSRYFDNVDTVIQAIQLSKFEITEVVCGCADGVDGIGERWAESQGIPVKRFPADWSLGLKAGPMRNAQMAAYADALILVWDTRSKGSASMKREAKKRGIPVFELVF